MTIRTAIVGWGLGGRCFHGAFVQTHPAFELVAVVTSRQINTALYPTTQVYADIEDVLARPDIDLVVIATPHFLHEQQAIAALQAGKPIVVEKPLVGSLDALDRLYSVANATGLHLLPYQNRRWDSDFLTLQTLIAEGRLGKLLRYEGRWSYYRPQPKARSAWKSNRDTLGGVIFDLSPHLIDQALVLFGEPQNVTIESGIHHPDRDVPDFVRYHLGYADGFSAFLEIDALNGAPTARHHLRGLGGTYEKFGIDPQEAALVADGMPTDDRWGKEPPEEAGLLYTAEGQTTITSQAGNYHGFYDAVAATLNDGAPFPITEEQVRIQLAMIVRAMNLVN